MYSKESDYWNFFRTVETSFTNLTPSFGLSSCKFEACGSLARGELRPPYSDIDLLIVASEGQGKKVRDVIPQFAHSLGKLLTIFADPFSSESTFCSIYSGPLKVDWFVAEPKKEHHDDSNKERITMVWNGNKPPPYDWESHPWDWLWWLWCKVHRVTNFQNSGSFSECMISVWKSSPQ